MVEAGATDRKAKWTRAPDRAAAIRQAVRSAAPADVLIIAGKGHERTQEVRGKKTPLSDVDEARRALAEEGRGKVGTTDEHR